MKLLNTFLFISVFLLIECSNDIDQNKKAFINKIINKSSHGLFYYNPKLKLEEVSKKTIIDTYGKPKSIEFVYFNYDKYAFGFNDFEKFLDDTSKVTVFKYFINNYKITANEVFLLLKKPHLIYYNFHDSEFVIDYTINQYIISFQIKVLQPKERTDSYGGYEPFFDKQSIINEISVFRPNKEYFKLKPSKYTSELY